MLGAIRKRDILAHPLVTIYCFGPYVFLKALFAGPKQTFLSLLSGTGMPQSLPRKALELIGRCVELELSAMRLYASLADRFSQPAAAKEFFESLAHQERGHAELLLLCKAAAGRSRWDATHLEPWREAVPRLEQTMQETEAALDSVNCLADALRLVLRVESSEVNQVFSSMIAASDSGFVRRLRVFQDAISQHISHICQGIPMLEPPLAQECREMLAVICGPASGRV